MSNKIGVHCQYMDGRAKNLIHTARPGILKVMRESFDRETLDWYRRETGGVSIGRVWTDDLAITTPTDTARRFVDRVMPDVELVQDLLDIFEADMNEWKQTHADELKWHSEFTCDVVRLMRLRVRPGLLLAVGCFGIGNPANPADIVRFRDAIAAGDVFTTHEYSWPRMQDGAGHNCLRYRAMRGHLVALNDPQVLKPWYIGETGLDRGVAEPQQHGDWGGWRNVTDAADYANQLRWYRGELDKDKYILGATIFNVGGGHDWRNFEIGDTPEIEAMIGESGISPRSILETYKPPVIVQPPAPPPQPPKEKTMTAADQAQFLADLWNQSKQPLNPTSAFYAYWAIEARAGRYMGLPTSAEFRTRDGKWGMQTFVAGIIHAQIGVWKVARGLPPLS